MFHALHHAEQPFIIANAWDVPSARAAQHAGYAALGTSSAAISAMLGYADREDMPLATCCASCSASALAPRCR
jgi:2-methylisocitrate lyase-like PEP mutase family enzyme